MTRLIAMKWILGGIIVIGLLIAVVWLIGRSLPVGHRAMGQRPINAPADEVWSRISDPGQWRTWRTDVEEIDLREDGFATVTDSNGTIRYRIERSEERTLVTTIDQEGLPFGGSWTWTVESVDERESVVTITEDGEIYNPAFRFLARYVFGHESTIESVLGQLEEAYR